MTRRFSSIYILTFILFILSSATQAQTDASSQSTIEALSNLPDSDMVVYVNPSRIINDALPGIVPEKDLQGMRSGLDALKGFTQVDLTHMDYIVVAMRFNKPAPGTLFPIPEAVFMARGELDAKALIAMAAGVMGEKLREEAYGTHSISLLKLSDVAGDTSKSPFVAPFSELAIVALDASTIAVGNTSYIKAALDAMDGKGRINPTKINALLRNPNALISLAGSPLLAFANSFALTFVKDRDRSLDMHRFGDYYVSLSMNGQDFKLNGTMNADNAETATIIKNMLAGALDQAKGYVSDKNAQSIMSKINLITEGSEIMLQADISKEAAAQFFRETFAPKPATSTAVPTEKKETVQTSGTTTTAKPKPKTRRSRRKN